MASRLLMIKAELVAFVLNGAEEELAHHAEDITALERRPETGASIGAYSESRSRMDDVWRLLDAIGWENAGGQDIKVNLHQHREALLRALEWQQQLAADHLRESGAKQDAMVLQRLGVLMELASSAPIPGAERQRRDAAQAQP